MGAVCLLSQSRARSLVSSGASRSATSAWYVLSQSRSCGVSSDSSVQQGRLDGDVCQAPEAEEGPPAEHAQCGLRYNLEEVLCQPAQPSSEVK